MKWTALAAAAASGAVIVFQWIQQARASVARGLERAERVTAATRQSLQETEQALRETRGTIS